MNILLRTGGQTQDWSYHFEKPRRRSHSSKLVKHPTKLLNYLFDSYFNQDSVNFMCRCPSEMGKVATCSDDFTVSLLDSWNNIAQHIKSLLYTLRRFTSVWMFGVTFYHFFQSLIGPPLEHPKQLLLKYAIPFVSEKESQGSSKNRKAETVLRRNIKFKNLWAKHPSWCSIWCYPSCSHHNNWNQYTRISEEKALLKLWSEKRHWKNSGSWNPKPFLCSKPSFLIKKEDDPRLFSGSR